MKYLCSICAALLIAAGFTASASAATQQGQIGLLPTPAVEKSAEESGHIKLAGGEFGAGLVTGIIGTIVAGKIIKHKRHYGHRYHRSRYHGRCSYWSRRCARNWGYGGSSYRGCLRYHGCY